MNKIVPVAIAIIHKDNKYLLTERKGNEQKVWHFPGGGVEFGETVENALHREIKEELNLTIKIEQQLSQVYSAIRPKWHGILIPFVCNIEGEENIKLDNESFQYGWFKAEEIKKLHTLPFVVEMLSLAEDGIPVENNLF